VLKAGWTNQVRHDAAYIEITNRQCDRHRPVKRQADVRGYNGQRVKKEINLINSHNEGTAK